MKNKYVAFFLLGLLIAGCQETQKGDRFTAKDQGFSLSVPNLWEVKENFSGIRLLVLSPLESERDVYRENISVMVEELVKPYTLEEFTSEAVAAVKSSMDSFEEVSRGEALIGGEKAFWVSYNYELPEARIQAVSYFLVREVEGVYYGYYITCSSTPLDYSKFAKEFENRVDSFRYEKMVTETE